MAKQSSEGLLVKTGIFAALAGVFYLLFNFFSGKKPPETNSSTASSEPKTEIQTKPHAENPNPNFEISPSDPTIYEPTSTTGDVVRHTWFSLSYSEPHEQAEWVAYELTRERLDATFAERPNTFRPDPDVKTESATTNDYRGSGYDRGHLCPASDMEFDAKAVDETFYMSNMSPQKKEFNVGIWRELEGDVRDWARRFGHVYVVAGPILTDKIMGQIGFSKVSVPGYFYKIVLAGDQAIGFLIPNEASAKPLADYAITIERLEKITGIDFFPKLLIGANKAVETRIDKSVWKFNEADFAKRLVAAPPPTQ